MKDRLSGSIEKLLLMFPFIALILSTGISSITLGSVRNELFSFILKSLDYITSFSIWIHLILLILFILYIFKNGNNKQKMLAVIIIFIMLFSYSNSLYFKNYVVDIKYELANMTLYSGFMFYGIYLLILYKKRGLNFIKEKFFSLIKLITIYIGFIYSLSIISNTVVNSYDVFPFGYSGWFRHTNALGHILVMILPILLYIFYKEKKWNTLLLIIINIICSLLIGTKAAYFGVYTSLIVFSIIYMYLFIKKKDINIYKGITIFGLLVLLGIFYNNFFAINFMRTVSQDLLYSENRTLDFVYTLQNGRNTNVFKIAEAYLNSGILMKLFGIGMYYPRYEIVQVEIDCFDILFKYGIFAFLIFIFMFFKYIISSFKVLYKKISKVDIMFVVMMLLSISLGSVASFMAGHLFIFYTSSVIYVYALLLLYFYSLSLNKIKQKKESSNKNYIIIIFCFAITLLIITVIRENRFEETETKLIKMVETAKDTALLAGNYIESNDIILPVVDEVLLIPLNNLYSKLTSSFGDIIDLDDSFILVRYINEGYYYFPQILTNEPNKYSIVFGPPIDFLVPREDVKLVYSLEEYYILLDESSYIKINGKRYYYNRFDMYGNVYYTDKEK